MWWIQYVLLFGAATLLSVGAFTGVGRGFASLLGVFAWFIVGNASAAVVYYDGAGTQHVAQSVPLTWLCYAVAAVHVVVLAIAIHDVITDEEDIDSVDDLADAIDPAAVDEGEIPHPADGTEQQAGTSGDFDTLRP